VARRTALAFVLALGLPVFALTAIGSGAESAALPGGWEQVGTNTAEPSQSALNGIVNALNTDKPGVLYVGGNFDNAGGDPNADYIAAWDGKAWKALGTPKLDGQVTSIAYRNGKVYAGGTFTSAAGDANAGFLAVWDGKKWSQPCKPKGPGSNVYALEISGSTLYIGGAFQRGAGIPEANYLMACDLNTGAARALVDPTGYVSSSVNDLAVDGSGTLYAGGGFGDLDDDPTADWVAAYRGGKWHGLGSGPGPTGGALTSWVRAVSVSGKDVYVGTDATDVAGIRQADNIARWDGSKWNALGANAAGTNGIFPPTSSVYAILVSGSRVFAGGTFLNANGNPLSDNIAVFDGKSWQPLGSDGAGNGAINAGVRALAVFGGKLYVGGNFTSVGGVGPASFLAAYSLSAPPGGGTTTTTTPGGTSGPPPTGTATGTVTVNGRPFTTGTVPYNATVDVTQGRLVLRADAGTLSVTGQGGTTAAFVLARGTDRGRSVVELRLAKGNFSVCPKRKTSGASAAAPTVVRQLWGDGSGRFRTKGRYSSATVRGTRWLTADRCDGTQTKVTRGVVQVNDLRRNRQVTVRAGGSYLARP
jgi:hypothetical protein